MQATHARTWKTVLDLVLKEIGEQRFKLWLPYTTLRSHEDGVAEVGAPNVFIKEWLVRNYADVLADSIARVTGSRPRLRFSVDPTSAERFRRDQEARQKNAPAEPVATTTPGADASPPAATAKRQALSLNAAYRFENFVVGPCNRLAYSAARSVLEEPGRLYNPLFIYGASGLGKTHLLQAVAWEFRRRRPQAPLAYITGEDFVNAFVESVKRKKVDTLRDRFRNVGVLIVDDVHVLSNKGRTQEEFLHTFNSCFNQNRQIIMASDSHPSAIKALRKELQGRFIAGLLARLDPPTEKTRLDILREKARGLNVAVPDSVLAFLACHIQSNVRHLEGALNRLAAKASLLNEQLTLELAARELRMAGEVRERMITLGDIEEAVLGQFSISSQELHSKTRKRVILVPRQIGMYLARQLTSHSLSEIGQYFGKRDHVTVLYGIRKIEHEMKKDPEFAGLVRTLEAKFRGPV